METIGKYQIERELGRGGMGVVYLGFDPELHRKVAIKVLNDRFSSESTVLKRFLQEARLVASLSHENVTVIHDLGQDEHGHPFIVMEYLEGEDLRDLLAQQRLPDMTRRLEIARQICNGLNAAHQRDVVHRDIKPANIFIRTDGKVKILDFGIAKSLSLKLEDSLTHGTIGTFNYMSPEQIEGNKVDTRSDIFSFGVTLYEMLTGQKPFQGESPATLMYKIAHEPPQPIAAELLDKNRGIDAIILRCLEKKPEDRYQSLLQVRDDLAAIVAGNFVPPALDSAQEETKVAGSIADDPTRIANTFSSDATGTVLQDPFKSQGSARVWATAGLIALLVAVGGWWFSRPSETVIPEIKTPTQEASLVNKADSSVANPAANKHQLRQSEVNLPPPPEEEIAEKTSEPEKRNITSSKKETAVNKQNEEAARPQKQQTQPPRIDHSLVFKRRADSLRTVVKNASAVIRDHKLGLLAVEAVAEAQSANQKADQQYSVTKFEGALPLYALAADWYRRASTEARQVQSAQQAYNNHNYQSAFDQLKALFAEQTYTVKNQKAKDLQEKAKTEKARLQEAFAYARREMRAGNLGSALDYIDQLPSNLRNIAEVENVRQEILAKDNHPPAIRNASPTRYNHRRPLRFRAEVEDQLALKQVVLCYRKKGDEEYLKQPMALAEGDKLFEAEVSPENHNGRLIQYYFIAEDEIGNIGELWRNNGEPFEVKRREKHSVPRPP